MELLGNKTPQIDLNILRKLAKRASRRLSGNGLAIEVGSWVGGSALVIAPYFQQLFCVDHFQGSPDDRLGSIARQHGKDMVFRTFCDNVGDDLFRRIFPCMGDSAMWASIWPFKVDLIFIDANHSYESARSDILAWLPHVHPEGIICGHDYSELFPGVKKAVNEIFDDFEHAGNVWWMGRAIDGSACKNEDDSE